MVKLIIALTALISVLHPEWLPLEGHKMLQDLVSAYLIALLVTPWVSEHFD